MDITLIPAKSEWKQYYYSTKHPAYIGHLRGDFGRSGEEFWPSWFDVNAELKTDEFRAEFGLLVDNLYYYLT